MDLIFKPPDPYVLLRLELRHEGLDIEKWSTINHVYSDEIKPVAFDCLDPYQRDSDWIRSSWSTGGKDTAFNAVHERHHLQPITVSQMQMIDEIRM